MTATTTEKPSYLGLLNAIANAETRAHGYLSAWAEVTPDPDVRAVLVTVARARRRARHGVREAHQRARLRAAAHRRPGLRGAHGGRVRRATRPTSRSSRRVGLLNFCPTDGEPDVFDNFFRDHSIDIQTGELLGRYIAEERDTLRLVPGCEAQLESKGRRGAVVGPTRVGLENKVDAVCRAVEELRQIVCAQSMPAESV